MNHQRTPQAEKTIEYLRLYPSHPSKTIARFLANQHPLLFYSVEYARDLVRAYRGNHNGGTNRTKPVCKRPNGTGYDQGIPLPEPIKELNPWAVKRIDFKRALVISDIHVPYHDPKAIRLAIEHGKKFGADCVIVNGDLVDFHSISFFERDPERRDLCEEREIGRYFLECLRDQFPKAQIVFHEGNHEERLWRYLWRTAPEFAKLPELSLRQILDLDEYGITLVADKQPILAGAHLYVLHGHEFRAPFMNPVNPARGLYLRAKANAMCGDLHQTSQHSEAGIDKVISCWSVGCLCDLHPRYMPLNKHNQGFATIEIHSDNMWQVENRKIINNVVV